MRGYASDCGFNRDRFNRNRAQTPQGQQPQKARCPEKDRAGFGHGQHAARELHAGGPAAAARAELPEQAALEAKRLGGVGEHRGRRGNEGALFEFYVHAREGFGMGRKSERKSEQKGERKSEQKDEQELRGKFLQNTDASNILTRPFFYNLFSNSIYLNYFGGLNS